MKHLYCAVGSDVNNDLTFKAKDKDKDQTYKDKDQDKDCILVLKESLRPRTRTRTNITGCGHASSLSCILTTFSADTMTSSNSFSTDLINGHFTVMSVYLSVYIRACDSYRHCRNNCIPHTKPPYTKHISHSSIIYVGKNIMCCY